MTSSRLPVDTSRNCHRYVGRMRANSCPSTWRTVLCMSVLACWVGGGPCTAQYTPLLSGGVGFETSTNGGNTTYFPEISPVLEAPLTDKVLIESKADLLEIISPRPHTGYDTSHFVGLSYLQADLQAAPQLTVTAGYFYTPFNTFIERLSPIWINDFVDGPIVSTVGIGTGSSLGAMVRGNAFQTSNVGLSYAAYYSARSSNEQFSSAHSSGLRLSMYSPSTGVEAGFSYNRMLGQKSSDNVGAFLWWTPGGVRFRFRSEYAHAPHAQGYWFEAGYPLTIAAAQQSFVSRFEPLFRFQQTFRSAADPSDGLPSANTQRADFGLDYALPHDLRVKTSYSRRFSSQGNSNIWQTGLVYRFLFPAWRSR